MLHSTEQWPEASQVTGKFTKPTRCVTILLVIAFCFLAIPAPTAASPQLTVEVNGMPVFFDKEPFLFEGTTLAPLDELSAILGLQAFFDPGSGFARVFGRGLMLQLKTGSNQGLLVNREVVLSVTPVLLNGMMYVPLRFEAEMFGAQVGWDAARRSVLITGEGLPMTPQPQPVIPYLPEDLELMARVISAEAGYQPYEGQVAVGAVIVNRVLSKGFFPDTIREVIYQPGQFNVVWNGMIDRPVVESARRAALEALMGEDPSKGALYFYNPAISRNTFLRSLTATAVIGDHLFAR